MFIRTEVAFIERSRQAARSPMCVDGSSCECYCERSTQDGDFGATAQELRAKAEAIPVQAWVGPEASTFQDNRHLKVVRSSAPRTGRLCPRKYCWYSFLLEAKSTPGS